MQARILAPEADRAEWLAALYQTHARAVRGYCQRFLKNQQDAEDATQEVFLRAIRSLDAVPASGQARRWLITVAQNYCFDVCRRRRRMQAVLTTLATEADAGEQSESDVMNRQLLEAVLKQLGTRDRRALWQSEIESRPIAEIAAQMGLSYMAAAQLVHRARKRAIVLAAKLAAILGLTGARTIRRRSLALSVGQPLAALAIVPLVAVLAVATGSAMHWHIGLGHTQEVATTETAHASASSAAAATTDDSSLNGGRQLFQPVRRTLHRTVQGAGQTINAVLKLVPTPNVLPTVRASAPVVPLPSLLPSVPGPPKH